MIKITMIFGKDAVRKYEENKELPSEEWLLDNGGVVDEKEFKTEAEYNAYVAGLNDGDGWTDYQIIRHNDEPKETDTRQPLNKQLRELTNTFVAELSCLTLRPDGWLPHVVYVEEEGDYPVYTMYKLEEIRKDGSCVLFNPKSGERFDNRHLYEINIDWLDTVLRWYYECCSMQSAEHEPTSTISSFRKNDIVKFTDNAIEMLRRSFGDTVADSRKDMMLRVEYNKQNEKGTWVTGVVDLREDDTQEFLSSYLRHAKVTELQEYVINNLGQ